MLGCISNIESFRTRKISVTATFWFHILESTLKNNVGEKKVLYFLTGIYPINHTQSKGFYAARLNEHIFIK